MNVLLFVCKFAHLSRAVNVVLAIINVLILKTFMTLRLERGCPMFSIGFFGGPGFSSTGFTTLATCLTAFTMAAVMGCRLRCVEKCSSRVTNLVLLITPLLRMVVTPVSKELSSGIGPRGLTTVKVFFKTVSLTVLSVLGRSAPL